MFSSLGIRSFRWVWLAALSGNSGRFAVILVAGWEAYRLGDHSSLWPSLVSMLLLVPSMFFGLFAGSLADRFNRKYTYIAFLVIAAILVPVFASVRNPAALLVIGPFVGFFGTGYFSGFVVIASELFPTHLRATAMGFVYNIGRVISAAAPWMIGGIAEHAGISAALGITSVAFGLAALVATGLRPHSKLVPAQSSS